MSDDILKGSVSVMKALEDIARKMGGGAVSVGFMNGATYPDGTGVAEVAYFNEFGTSRTPSRPFFRRMIADKSPTWPAQMAKAAKAAKYDGAKVLALMGEEIKGQLQASIRDMQSPPLADSTVKAKGFAKPLIDTGHMLNSITYDVEQ